MLPPSPFYKFWKTIQFRFWSFQAVNKTKKGTCTFPLVLFVYTLREEILADSLIRCNLAELILPVDEIFYIWRKLILAGSPKQKFFKFLKKIEIQYLNFQIKFIIYNKTESVSFKVNIIIFPFWVFKLKKKKKNWRIKKKKWNLAGINFGGSRKILNLAGINFGGL